MEPILADHALDHFVIGMILWVRIRSRAGAIEAKEVLIVFVILVEELFVLLYPARIVFWKPEEREQKVRMTVYIKGMRLKK